MRERAKIGSFASVRFRSPKFVMSADEEVGRRRGGCGPESDAATERILTVLKACFHSSFPFEGPGVAGIPASLPALGEVEVLRAAGSSGDGKDVSEAA